MSVKALNDLGSRCMTDRKERDTTGMELPQSIIDSFARSLLPEIRKYYESEEGKREFEEWEKKCKANEKLSSFQNEA